MTGTPVGHIGHWWTSVLYLLPIVVVVAVLAVQSWRARRRNGDAG